MSETHKEQVERVAQMSSAGWYLKIRTIADADVAAFRTVLLDRAELLEACKKLANEAASFLGLSDIERHGMTNTRILRDRIYEARNAIAKAEGAE